MLTRSQQRRINLMHGRPMNEGIEPREAVSERKTSNTKTRLMDLIRESRCVDVWDHRKDDFKDPDPIKTLTDFLLENGAVVPPCRLGDEFYMIDDFGKINAWIVCDMSYDSTYDFMIYLSRKDSPGSTYTGISNDINEILFSTYEDAARAIVKGRETT